MGPETLIAAQNADGSLITDNANAAKYRGEYLMNSTGFLQPTIGLIWDF